MILIELKFDEYFFSCECGDLCFVEINFYYLQNFVDFATFWCIIYVLLLARGLEYSNFGGIVYNDCVGTGYGLVDAKDGVFWWAMV